MDFDRQSGRRLGGPLLASSTDSAPPLLGEAGTVVRLQPLEGRSLVGVEA